MDNSLQKDMFQMLFSKYGTMNLSKKQCSEVTGKSISKLESDKRDGIGIEYKQETAVANVYYPLHCIVEFLTNNNSKAKG